MTFQKVAISGIAIVYTVGCWAVSPSGKEKIEQMNEIGEGILSAVNSIASSTATNPVLTINVDNCMGESLIDFSISHASKISNYGKS